MRVKIIPEGAYKADDIISKICSASFVYLPSKYSYLIDNILILKKRPCS